MLDAAHAYDPVDIVRASVRQTQNLDVIGSEQAAHDVGQLESALVGRPAHHV